MPPEPRPAISTQTTLAQTALAAFDAAVAAAPALRLRAGQRQMAERVAHTLAAGTLDSPMAEAASAAATTTSSAHTSTHTQPPQQPTLTNAPAPERAIAVIEAGTGVGKSLAYSAPAVALAIARGTRVIISTATVALQEQLTSKDLPALAALMAQNATPSTTPAASSPTAPSSSSPPPPPFTFALAKGRARFVCKFKLYRLAQMGDFAPGAAWAVATEDLFAEDEEDEHKSDDAPHEQPYASDGQPRLKTAYLPLGDQDETAAQANLQVLENTEQSTQSNTAPSTPRSRYPNLQAARRNAAKQAAEHARVQWFADRAHALQSGAWDGERDSLSPPPDNAQWSAIAAHAHTCTARHCPLYGGCTYYARRRELAAAQVIVANHDLLLSSLGSRLLPAPSATLLVFDEAHHLPTTAIAQFASHMDLTRLRWLDTLERRALRVGAALAVEEIADVPAHARDLRQALQALAAAVAERARHAPAPQPRPKMAERVLGVSGTKASFATVASSPKPAALWPATQPEPAQRLRLPRGVVEEDLAAPLAAIRSHAHALARALRSIARALRTHLRDSPQDAPRLSVLYAQLGASAPSLDATLQTAQLFLSGELEENPKSTPDNPEHNPQHPPNAKWFTLQTDMAGFLQITAHASPLLPGPALRQNLWSATRAAVLSSATLSTAGRFDFFLREAGLVHDSAVSTLRVPSPFNYAAQGRLIARPTRADPSDADAFTQEMLTLLFEDLASCQSGALVLFTSRQQLHAACDLLGANLAAHTLVQTELPRQQLLQRHRERVAAGLPSIIFGLQSFGEGLDLPGPQCQSLFITKLPFAPPDDPVSEARAEWLKSRGGNPFMELVVPATAIRLAQWMGRAIRTENDTASVYCYDRRLFTTHYGEQLLKGLPDFARVNF